MKKVSILVLIIALFQNIAYAKNKNELNDSYKKILDSAEASIKDNNPSQAISILQKAYLEATDCYYNEQCKEYKKTGTLERIGNHIDDFFSHVTVSQKSAVNHNLWASIVLKYDDIPLEINSDGISATVLSDDISLPMRFINGDVFVNPNEKLIHINPIYSLDMLIYQNNKIETIENYPFTPSLDKVLDSHLSKENYNNNEISAVENLSHTAEKNEIESKRTEMSDKDLAYRVIKKVLIVKDLFEKDKPNEIFENVRKKHWLKLDIKSEQEKLFHVTKENLYYAAIKSKDLPEFTGSSESQTENFAICLNAILEFSGIKSDYSVILKEYLKTEKKGRIEDLVKRFNIRGEISGRKMEIFFNSNSVSFSVKQYLTEELMRGRLIISIDKKGESSLVTSIGLKKEGENYTPVSVKIRIPTLPKTEQRKEISWSDFKANNLAIAVVNIY